MTEHQSTTGAAVTYNDPRRLIMQEIGELGTVPGGIDVPLDEPTADAVVVLFETCDGRLSIAAGPGYWWEVLDEDAPHLPDDDSVGVVAKFYDVLDACRYVRDKVELDACSHA